MIPLLPRTLQSRLIASHLLVALAGIFLVSIYAGWSTYSAARSQVEHDYETLAFAASHNLEQPLSDLVGGKSSASEVKSVIDRSIPRLNGPAYTLYLPDGSPLVSSGGGLPPKAEPAAAPEIWEALQSDIGEGKAIRLDPNGKNTLFLAKTIDRDRQILGVLRLEIPLTSALDSARRSLGLLLLTDLAVALGVSAVGYWLARSLSNPVKNITTTAEKLSQGDLNARVEAPARPLELNHLGVALNTMASRLQANLDELRSFVANASHELRTPLTSVKLRVEALRSGASEEPAVAERFLEEIESEVDRLIRMVNDLLDLSRIEAGLASQERARLDLASIASEVCETFGARAEKLGVSLRLSTQPDLPLAFGNEDQLRRMMYNMVDNAIKYTTRGGHVDLVLEAGKRRDCVRMIVKDTGFGISPKNLPHIFERFYRVEATRPRYGSPQGSGLGLPIAKSIVETHGGKIAVTSQIGEGTTFVVELPAEKS